MCAWTTFPVYQRKNQTIHCLYARIRASEVLTITKVIAITAVGNPRHITRVLFKSLVTTAVVFGGICHRFRRALSSVVGLYSATAIHPKVLQAIFLGLISAELDLSVSSFVPSGSVYHVPKSKFLVIGPPCM